MENAALNHVKRLQALPPQRFHAVAQADAQAIGYEYPLALNGADSSVYLGCGVFSHESGLLADIAQLAEEGRIWLAKLYTYRSCARAIPTGNELADKSELNRAVYEVLQPQVEKVRAIIAFGKGAVDTTFETLKALAMRPESAAFVSPHMFHGLARLLSMLLVLDELKDMKACIINDMSIFKRVATQLRSRSAEAESTVDDPQQNLELHGDLQQHRVFLETLAKRVTSIPGYAELLWECAQACLAAVEERLYISGATETALVRAAVVCLTLIGKTDKGGAKGLAKRFRFADRCLRFFKGWPLLTLYGDMTVSVVDLLKRGNAPEWLRTEELQQHADAAVQAASATAAAGAAGAAAGAAGADSGGGLGGLQAANPTINLVAGEAAYTDAQALLLRELTVGANCVVGHAAVDVINKDIAAFISDAAVRALRLVAEITAKLVKYNAFKYAHPVNPGLAPKNAIPPEATAYELAVRYNYTPEEMDAFANMVVLAKTLAATLMAHQALIYKALTQTIGEQCQTLVEYTLNDAASHLAKRKRPAMQELDLLSIVLRCGPPSAAGANNKVYLADSQLAYVRTLLLQVFGEPAKRGAAKKSEFKEHHLEEVDKFVQASYMWTELYRFHETVAAVGDLSDLWLKEFYLEITKQIQFSIDTSLPWMLASRLLASVSPEAIEDIFLVLDVYNDAARATLHELKCQYLFDELEAETNLCFVQIVFELGQRVYTHYKQAASVILVEKKFKNDLETLQGFKSGHYDCPKRTYGVLLAQRSLQLLGRSIDLSQLLAMSFNQSVRKSIDVAITRFEASDLNYLKDLESLLDVTRCTHSLLGEHLPLDSWDSLLREVDERLALHTTVGRISAHISSELAADFLPNWSYNAVTSRFVRAPIAMGETPQRSNFAREKIMHHYGSKHLFTLYASQLQLFKGFLGKEHTDVVVRLLGAEGAVKLVDDLVEHICAVVEGDLSAYTQAVNTGMPYSVKLPPHEFGMRGSFDYFQVVLKPLLTYKDMKTGFLQVLREVGNAIVFVQLLQSSLRDRGRVHARLYNTQVKQIGDAGELVSKLPLYAPHMNVLKHTQNAVLENNARDVWAKMDLEMRFMDALRSSIQAQREAWEGSLTATQYLTEDHVREFHKVWSVALFVYNLPGQSLEEFSSRQLFGDALLFAGHAITYFLNEIPRFQAFDFTSYLVQLGETEPPPSPSGKDKDKDPARDVVGRFLGNARQAARISARYVSRLRQVFPE